MIDPNTFVDNIQKTFQDQHKQMIAEQAKLLDDYKDYFSNLIQRIEDQVNAMNPPEEIPKEHPKQTDKIDYESLRKEISEIGSLLDDAVKIYGKDLTEILTQLTERQKKKVERILDEIK
jgi:gas vesicle protein